MTRIYRFVIGGVAGLMLLISLARLHQQGLGHGAMLATGLMALLALLLILATLRHWRVAPANAWFALLFWVLSLHWQERSMAWSLALIGGALLLVLTDILAALAASLQRRCCAHRVAEREELSDDAIHARYYADAGLDRYRWGEAWREVASILRVPPGLLRPDDPLAWLNGMPPRIFGLVGDVALLIFRVRNEAVGRYQLPAKMETVDDIVRHLAEESAEYRYPPDRRTRYAGDDPSQAG